MAHPPPLYAPTATTSYTISLQDVGYDQDFSKQDLVKNPLHQSLYDSLAEIYSIIPTLDMIETSFIKDYITDKEKYTSTSLRLINQYQLLLKGFEEDDNERKALLKTLLSTSTLSLESDLSNFLPCLVEKFRINCSLGVKRLQVGYPATIQHLLTQVESTTLNNASGKLVAEITGNFITCIDALKLNYNTKLQLHPLLSTLVVNLNDLVEVSPNHNLIDFKGKSKLVTWLIKVNNLGDETLAPEDCDSFLEDLDTAYKGFYASLE